MAEWATDAQWERLGTAGMIAWQRQVKRTGGCSHPVRLRGGATAVDTQSGEVRAAFTTTEEPDGSLLVACKDRRAAVCPSCAQTYRADMWHLIAAGLRGRPSAPLPGTAAPSSDAASSVSSALAGSSTSSAGSGPTVVTGAVPSSVSEHPLVFVTLTAPSFGAVHSHRDGGVCHPARGANRPRRPHRCPHGRPVTCTMRHDDDAPELGRPLCAECWDYTGAVLWNAHVGELWRRTRIAIDRALSPLVATVLGERVSTSGLRDLVRISYVKVAEVQRRGLVHLHLVMRLDGVDPDDRSAVIAPPTWATTTLLAQAVHAAVARTAFALPSPDGRARSAQWGRQFDVSEISATATATGTGARKVAGYLAKYTTKTASDAVGSAAALARRLRQRPSFDALRAAVGWHLARLVETAWMLGRRRDLADLKLRHWAHTLGFRGHVATKSRRYSITLTLLRTVRRLWNLNRTTTDTNGDRDGVDSAGRNVWAAAHLGTGMALVGDWRYAGRGHLTAGDVDMAEALAQRRAEARAAYRDQLDEERRRAADLWLTPDEMRTSRLVPV